MRRKFRAGRFVNASRSAAEQVFRFKKPDYEDGEDDDAMAASLCAALHGSSLMERLLRIEIVAWVMRRRLTVEGQQALPREPRAQGDAKWAAKMPRHIYGAFTRRRYRIAQSLDIKPG